MIPRLSKLDLISIGIGLALGVALAPFALLLLAAVAT